MIYVDNSKGLAIKLASGFIGVLLFLTFFSNTLISLNLPGVVVSEPTHGGVSATFRGSGKVEFAEVFTLFAEDSGRINFAVRPGDRVSYGSVLFTIETDREYLIDRMEDEQSRLDATLINLARTQGDLEFEQSRLRSARANVNQLPATTIHPPDITRFEYEARRLQAAIEQAEDEHQTNIVLFNEGIISQTQLNDSVRRIDQLRESYARNAEEMEVILQRHADTVSDAEEARRLARQQQQQAHNAELESIRHRISNLEHSVRLLENEEADRRRSVQRLYDQIEKDGVMTVYAESHIAVREIPAGLESGMMVQRNQIIMRYANPDSYRFIITAYFPERMGSLPFSTMILHQTRVSINIPAIGEYGISGQVLRSTPGGGHLQKEIAFTTARRIRGSDLRGGETAEVIFEQILGEAPELVLPNSAIRRDGMGRYFMYVIREPNTLLGYSYIAQQGRGMFVHEGDRYSTFLVGEIEGPIIIRSDRPFAHGSRVRVVGDE